MKKVKALAASGNLSTGFREETLVRAVQQGADFIGCDAGTTDSGPYYLGSGNPRGPREATKRNLRIMMREGLKAGVPVIVGSAGHAGGSPHLAWTLDIVRELARENEWHFRLAAIESEIPKAKMLEAFLDGRVTPLCPAPKLDETSIQQAERFVAMMGIEPIQSALTAGAQVVIAGRCSDVAIYAAFPVMKGIPKDVAFHAGKILECGSAAVAQRFYTDCMAAELDQDGFTIEPPNPTFRCTPQSVAAHTLYENADPYLLVESGGTVDTTAAQYEAISDRAVRVTGARFLPAQKYTVKIEGAALAGYRSIVVAGIRDPLILRQLDTFLKGLRAVVGRKIEDSLKLRPCDYTLQFRVYGSNGSLGQVEPCPKVDGHEVGLIIDVVASSQSLAADILPIVWHTGLHHPIPEHEGLISNFAFPFSPPGADMGPVYRFCANHVWELDDPCEPFRMTIENL
ncbi:MAG TPA: acyclic terpene utilization AtuA family protein [Candidatus Acidoferrales bacterium]|nr:acyclic terpene utilization AtuA family protein [Candidatus Acidoferrales bacterium]